MFWNWHRDNNSSQLRKGVQWFGTAIHISSLDCWDQQICSQFGSTNTATIQTGTARICKMSAPATGHRPRFVQLPSTRRQATIRSTVQYLATGHDKSENPLVRSNPERRLGNVDDVRRISVTRTRATHSLVVIGDKDTFKSGYGGGLSCFIRNVYARGLNATC